MLRRVLLIPCVGALPCAAGCDFLLDALTPDAPAVPTTPFICMADEGALGGEAATFDVRLAVAAMAAPSEALPAAFSDCVGDGEVWEILDSNGDRAWLGIVGASDEIVEGINAAVATGSPLALHVATDRDTAPGTDVFALSFADTGLPAVAFQRNGPVAIADAGVVGVSTGSVVPVVSSDACGLFEFPELLFVGGEADLTDERGVPDPETGELPVLVPGRVTVGMGGRAAVFSGGEIVDVAAGVVFARADADCPDPPPTGQFMNWTARLRR